MSMPTISNDDNFYTLPTIFHNIEQESGSKTRVRALTRDPTRPGPKLFTRWHADPWPGDPVPSLVWKLYHTLYLGPSGFRLQHWSLLLNCECERKFIYRRIIVEKPLTRSMR